MQITRSNIDTQKGPADWFTGDVYIEAIAAPAGTSTFALRARPLHPRQSRRGSTRWLPLGEEFTTLAAAVKSPF